MSAEPLKKIGRYELLTLLSRGGMAELYLACLRGPGGFRKFVTLKRILPELREEEEFLAMFMDEARITAGMSHANIAQMFELGEEGSELFITMEFVAGQEVRRVQAACTARNERVPLGVSCAVMRDTCAALHYAHTFTSPGGRLLPVIHRDVSPRNTMITWGGATKVIDFGIAKAKGKLSTTRAGRVKGSPAYMSPEQIRGEALDGRSDVFSAGAVLYELITGLKAFAAPDEPAVMFKVMTADVEPADALNPEVPRELALAVAKALSREPSDRFETAKDFGRAIEAAVAPWSEERIGDFVSRLFTTQRRSTQALLAMAGEESAERVVDAAHELGEFPSTSGSSSVAEPRNPSRTELTAEMQIAVHPAVNSRPVVLVVDDSKVGRMLVERVLTSGGYEVVTASSGAEGLEMLTQLRAELLVLDVVMPDMDGFELSRRIRSLPDFGTTPVLFLSAACSIEERAKGIAAGGDDFIRKPFDGPDLLARVRLHLQRVRAQRNATTPLPFP